MPGKFSLLATLATFVCCFLTPCSSLYFFLDNKTPRCFTETLEGHMLWNIQIYMPDLEELNDYREADDLDLLEVKVTVTELQGGDIVKEESFVTEGTVPFTASQDGGVYRVCFSRTDDTVLDDEDKLDELVRVDFDLEVEQYFEDKKINHDTVVQREHVEDLETKLKVRKSLLLLFLMV